jgi:hypothetical protein
MQKRIVNDISELADEQWVIDLQMKLGLPAAFFKKLLQEDDWSFGIVTRLELSNKTFGKLAFMKELKLLSDDGRRYVSSLSEWRNKFVHNVRNCSASLPDIVSKMDGNELKKFAEDFNPQGMRSQRFEKMNLPGSDVLATPAPKIDDLKKRAKDNPRLYIWLGGYDLLVEIIDKYAHNEYILYGRALEMAGQYEEDDKNDPEEEQDNDLEKL